MSSKESSVSANEPVIHLHRDLFLVDPTLIRYADGSSSVGGVNFVNPRHVHIAGKSQPRGFDQDEMLQLRESIRTQGLKHPLILFGKPTGQQAMLLLSGERRLRNISVLRKENTPCFNPETGNMEPARDLYQYVECRITQNADVKALYKAAFTINDTSKDIGEVQVVSLVKQWKDEGWTDEDIMQVTNKSITWLRESFDIIGLDDKCYTAFLSEEVNRTCAISLSEVKDVRDRQTRLAKMKSKAIERQQAMEQQAQMELEAAEEEAQIAEANAELAETTRAKTENKEKAKKARRKVKQKERVLQQVRSRRAKATGKELDRVKAEFDGVSGKQLTLAKYRKHWLPVLEKAKQGQVPSMSAAAATMLQDIMENAFYANRFDLEAFLSERQAQQQPQEKAA